MTALEAINYMANTLIPDIKNKKLMFSIISHKSLQINSPNKRQLEPCLDIIKRIVL